MGNLAGEREEGADAAPCAGGVGASCLAIRNERNKARRDGAEKDNCELLESRENYSGRFSST